MKLEELIKHGKVDVESLSEICVWLGPAYLEQHSGETMGLFPNSSYLSVGCYECRGKEDLCKFYDSEKKIIQYYMNRGRDGRDEPRRRD